MWRRWRAFRLAVGAGLRLAGQSDGDRLVRLYRVLAEYHCDGSAEAGPQLRLLQRLTHLTHRAIADAGGAPLITLTIQMMAIDADTVATGIALSGPAVGTVDLLAWARDTLAQAGADEGVIL